MQHHIRAMVPLYAMERGRFGRSLENIHHTLNGFEKHLGRRATVDDFDDRVINAWCAWQFAKGLDPETVRGRRTLMVGIWKWAADNGLVRRLPGKLPKIKVPEKPPQCWHLDELRKLLAAASQLPGTMRRDFRVPRSAFATAWLRADYATGFRFADLHELDARCIAPDGTVVIVQQKTRQAIVGHLDDAALASLDAIRSPARRRPFRDLLNRKNLQVMVRSLVKAAGLSGSTKWIRRTGATWIEVHQPGAAMGYLGHNTPGLARKRYIDSRYLQQNKPRPPKLDLPNEPG